MIASHSWNNHIGPPELASTHEITTLGHQNWLHLMEWPHWRTEGLLAWPHVRMVIKHSLTSVLNIARQLYHSFSPFLRHGHLKFPNRRFQIHLFATKSCAFNNKKNARNKTWKKYDQQTPEQNKIQKQITPRNKTRQNIFRIMKRSEQKQSACGHYVPWLRKKSGNKYLYIYIYIPILLFLFFVLGRGGGE